MAGRLPVGITCFAKWTDDTCYNLEILAKNEASYSVTYIDYGNSEDVLEGDIVGDVGEIPDTDYIDQFVYQAVKVSVRCSTKTKIWWRISSEQLWPT